MKKIVKKLGVLVLALSIFLALGLSAGASLKSTARVKVDDIDWNDNQIIINITQKTRVDISVIQKIKDDYSNVPVLIRSNHYAYRFAAGSLYVNTLLGYIDFGVDIQYSEYKRDAGVNSNVKYLRELSEDPAAVVVNFYYDNKLPAEADLAMQLGEENANTQMGYYRFNQKDNDFEFIGNVNVDKDGFAVVRQSVGGTYIFSAPVVK